MKKTTIYTLLCTTIMIPGFSLAMEEDSSKSAGTPPPSRRQQEPATPERAAEEKKRLVIQNIGPCTPDIEAAAQKRAANTTYNPRVREMFVKAQVQMDKAERDAKRGIEFSQIEVEKDREMQSRILEKEKTLREAQENRLQGLLQSAQRVLAEKEVLGQKLGALEAELIELREEKIKAKEAYEKEKDELNQQHTQDTEIFAELLEQLTKSYDEKTRRLEKEETEKRQALEELHKVKLAKETAELKGNILEEGIKNLALQEPEKVDSSKPTPSTFSGIPATPPLVSSPVATTVVPDNASKDPAPQARKTLGKSDFGSGLPGAANKGDGAGEKKKGN